MNSLRRFGAGSRGRAGWVGPLIGLLAISSAACGQGGLSNSQVYSPPPALALVALVDPSSARLADELHQLQDVIRTTATPGEAVVVKVRRRAERLQASLAMGGPARGELDF